MINLYVNEDKSNDGYIISVDNNNYSDDEMAKQLHIDEFEYMNFLSLNGSIKYERIHNNTHKVYSIFENIKNAEDVIDKMLDNYIII